MEIRRLLGTPNSAVVAVVEQSDQYLESLYPPESNHAEPLEALLEENSAFFVCYVGDDVAGCGGVKIIEGDDTFGEIKRVFVKPEYRGKKVAIQIIKHLETYLLKQEIKVVRLEAGPLQPAALSLYRKLGYQERGPFGHYKPDPLSVFMEKQLST